MHTFDIIIIGSGAGGGTMARALAGTGAKILDRRARRLRSAGRSELESRRRSGRTCATAPPRRGSTRPAQPFRPYTHYCVGGNTKFWGTVMYRLRPEDFKAVEHVDGISPAWPIDYDTLAPYYDRAEAMYQRARRGRRRSDRGPARPVSVSAGPPLHGRRRHRRAAEGAGTASVAAAARPSRQLRLLQHLQFVPVQDSREERCGSLRGEAGDGERPTSTLWTNAIRAQAGHRCERHGGSRPSRSSATARSRRCPRRS